MAESPTHEERARKLLASLNGWQPSPFDPVDAELAVRDIVAALEEVERAARPPAPKEPLKVRLITGTREWGQRSLDARAFLDEERPNIVIVGDAAGVDQAVRAWCKETRTGLLQGMWTVPGGRGGLARNEVMAEALRCFRVAGHDAKFQPFPGPDSKGTWDTVRRCEGKELEQCRK